MVATVLGVGMGILFFRTLVGIGPLLALCLFSLLGFACWYYSLFPLRTFALALVFSLLRCLLLPDLSLPVTLLRPFSAAREALVLITEHLFPKQESSLLCAMLWGIKGSLSEYLHAVYRGAGIAHVLALSGLHVSFVSVVLNRLAKNASIRLRLGVNALVLFSYSAVAAFPASLVRASLMCLCPLLAEALGRKKDQASSIAFSAVCILVFSPSALYDIGFQLSFGAVAVIDMLGRTLAEHLPLPEQLGKAVSLSICGMLGTLPLTAHHFGEMALLSIFANLLILPIVPVAFLFSMAACLAGSVYIRLGEFLAPSARLFVSSMHAAAQAVSAFPFALVQVPRPGFITCALLFGAMLPLSRYCILPARKKWAYGAALFAAALLPML
ncbi:MAG: ComEC/Rec2 family competence protein [Candidatus Pelethousia sp.]|nr:ComEC/Rec2 family competence protein [Candidatus Pelethousia sp.]